MFSFTAKTVGRFFRKPHAPPRAVPQEAPIEEELGLLMEEELGLLMEEDVEEVEINTGIFNGRGKQQCK